MFCSIYFDLFACINSLSDHPYSIQPSLYRHSLSFSPIRIRIVQFTCQSMRINIRMIPPLFFYPYRIRKDITFLPASLKLACPTTVAAQQHSPQKEIPFFKEIFYLFCPPARSPIAWRRWSRLMSLTILVKLLTYVRNYYNTNVPHQCNTIQYKYVIILILVSISDTLNTECHF